MKTLTRLLTVAALASLFALPSFAQDAAANPCESQERTDLYTKYFNEKKNTNDQKPAFETAKQYLAKYESACPDQYSQAVRKFHDAYEKAVGEANVAADYQKAVAAKDARRAFETARPLLAKDAEDVGIYLTNAALGYNAVIQKGSNAGDAALTAETVAAANKAIELIQAGREPKDPAGKPSWGAFKSRDEALAWAHYVLGTLQFKTDPASAVTHMVAVAQSNTSVKEQPTVYTVLAAALDVDRVRMVKEYEQFKEENDQSRILYANINQNLDRQIDALARAVAYEKDGARKEQLMTDLKTLYKARHNSEEGLQAKIDAVRTTPLLVTTPITTPPPPAPAPTPANNQPVAERKP
jgi:hypothetical protein